MKSYVYLFIIMFCMALAGCNNSYLDDIDRGAGYNFRPGYPELRLSASGYVDTDESTKLIISADVVFGSLVYKEENNQFHSEFVLNIQVVDDSTSQPVINNREYTYAIDKENGNIVNSQNVFRFEEEFEIDPGQYTIKVVVTDKNSGKQTLRKATTTLPDPDDRISHLTEIRILGKDSRDTAGTFYPVTTYDVPGRYDSLKFVFQVTNNIPEEPLTLEYKLLKFDADSIPARPMNFNNQSPSSIGYKGIEYADKEVIQSSRRVLNDPGSVLIELVFTDLERGNYRLEVTSVNSEGKEDDRLYRGRDFSIKSENYPSVKNPRELARALAYLMDRREHEKLMNIESNDSLKIAMDRFWLSNLKNTATAKNVISLYYQRVEEANKQFSNFQEGWKTDPGMIYILFGPPWYVDSFSDEMTWFYSYNRYDPEKIFQFTKPRLKSKYYPFDHYLLLRDNSYYSLHRQQVYKWLTGEILKTNL